MKIVFLDAKTIGDDIDLSAFEKLGEVVTYNFSTTEEALERTVDADVIVLNKVEINEHSIGKAKKLKLVCVTATGTNNLDKEYLKKDYSGIVMGIMCLWLALFTFKYGQFLFLELLPVLVSLLLFFMGISSLIKYFDRRVTANMIVSIISIILGIILIFVSKNVMYIFFKIIGVYIFVMVILDFINYKKIKDSNSIISE
jgi:phosphoglycerol transferase MdoB-like AlkP superfamily enzyme